MNEVVPERIIQARELQGWTKTELADRVHVTPAAVSQWESGTKRPLPDHVHRLADALNVQMGFFFREVPAPVRTRGPLTFRSWMTAKTRRTNLKALRLAELVAETYLWMNSLVEFPEVSLPEFENRNPTTDEEMAAFAQDCRRFWGLGDRPILKLGEFLESKGIIVLRTSFGDERFDAFSCIIAGRTFIFLGADKKDRGRSRFDAAHELGHLIMHQHLSEEELAKKEVLETVERQANMFAACFLMPPETFTADIRDTTLRGFLSLKSKWGTSAKAMITHSKRYDHRMTDSAATELYRQMSARGMNKAKGEPFDDVVPEVSSSLTRKALDLVKENGLRQPWEIPFELPLPKVSLQVALSMTPEELIKSGDGTESKIIELRSGRTAEFQHLFHQARPPV